MICSNIDFLNDIIREYYLPHLEENVRFKNTYVRGNEGFHGKFAEWYPFPEGQVNLIAECAGLGHWDPLFFVDGDRLVFQFEGKKQFLNTDGLCDQNYVRSSFDPHAINRNPMINK